MTIPSIGHNQGPPLEAGRSWRRHLWARAKTEQLPRLGIETVRRHVRRAAQLGLTYPQYASIRVGTGRDVRALLFSAAALGWRGGALPAPAVRRIEEIEDADALLLARLRNHQPGAPVRSGPIRFAAAGPPPKAIGEARAAVRAVLDPLALPGDAVVMIGDHPAQAIWADQARLARFIPAEAWARD